MNKVTREDELFELVTECFPFEKLPGVQLWLLQLTKDERCIYEMNRRKFFNIRPISPELVTFMTINIAFKQLGDSPHLTAKALFEAKESLLIRLYTETSCGEVIKPLTEGLSKSMRKHLHKCYRDSFGIVDTDNGKGVTNKLKKIKGTTVKTSATVGLTADNYFTPRNVAERMLYTVLSLNDDDIFIFIRNYLSILEKDFMAEEKDQNYILVKGKGEVMLVAHMDTMRDKSDYPVVLKEKISSAKREVTNDSGVLGGDDRAGIAALLLIASVLDVPILFTNYEESRTKKEKGVVKFCEEYPVLPVKGINLFVELDRKGTKHYALYHDLPYYFEQKIKKITEVDSESGTYSDIKTLTKFYKIPSINLAVGFSQQHTRAERLVLDDWYWSVQTACKLLNSNKDMPAIPVQWTPQEKSKYVNCGTTVSGYNYGFSSYTLIAYLNTIRNRDLNGQIDYLSGIEINKMLEDEVLLGALLGAIKKYGTKTKGVKK